MTPRPYRMERRRQSTDQNRQRILNAARELLASQEGARFSMEEVARRAGVARMTVYYQFGSLPGLLRALLDSLAVAGGMDHLGDAFRKADPLEALDEFVAVFFGFWESDRAVIRGLSALAVLNAEFAAVLEERYSWRRKGVRLLLERVAKQIGAGGLKDRETTADVIYMLSSFTTYDMLARPGRSREQVTALVQRLVRRALS